MSRTYNIQFEDINNSLKKHWKNKSEKKENIKNLLKKTSFVIDNDMIPGSTFVNLVIGTQNQSF